MMNGFVEELYDLMKKYSIHRIYIAYRNYGENNDFIENHQALTYNIQKYYNHVPSFVLRFIERNFPFYYKKIVTNYTSAYKEELHQLLKKYDIDYIKMTAINLSYGVVRCSNKILMKGITICQGGVTTKIKNKEYKINDTEN